jgi:hypothetical protein
MHVLSTETEDGVSTMTVSIAEDDHRFEVWAENGEALVEYQETLSWRGEIQTSKPDDHVFKSLMISEEMTEMLNKWGVSGVRRAAPTA